MYDLLIHGATLIDPAQGIHARRDVAFANDAKWRTFEVTTRLEVTDPVGAVRAWVPVPLTSSTD